MMITAKLVNTGDALQISFLCSHYRIIDYIIKIVGGAVTFSLIAIDLRRRFERKYMQQDMSIFIISYLRNRMLLVLRLE